jgi:hypothetical protein
VHWHHSQSLCASISLSGYVFRPIIYFLPVVPLLMYWPNQMTVAAEEEAVAAVEARACCRYQIVLN